MEWVSLPLGVGFLLFVCLGVNESWIIVYVLL